MNPHTTAKALQLMIERTHGKRSDGTYKFLHPIRVALSLGGDVVISGLLHDMLEDTETEYREIEYMFGEKVAKTVQALTHGEESDEGILKRVREGGEDAVKVKLADNMDNMRTISYFKPERQESYLRYSNSINDLGREMLGHNHPLVSLHGEMYKFAYELPF